VSTCTLACLEDEVTVDAPDKRAAKYQALEAVKERPFELSEADMRVKVVMG